MDFCSPSGDVYTQLHLACVAWLCHNDILSMRAAPAASLSLFAGALLYDARRMFDAGNAKADDTLRSIVDRLPEAVTACLEAATADMDLVRQTALLKVSSQPACCRPVLAHRHAGPLAVYQVYAQTSLELEVSKPGTGLWNALSGCVQAAIYGRAFCGTDSVPRMAIREAAQRLRLLNAMRR